jgi:uncharacterized protein (TIGR02246 family)
VSEDLSTKKSEEAEIIDQQYQAYEKRDLERFLSFYADDAKIHIVPSGRCLDGLSEIREVFEQMFASSQSIRVNIDRQLVTGRYVMDREYARIMKDDTAIEVISLSMYRVENGKIRFLSLFILD